MKILEVNGLDFTPFLKGYSVGVMDLDVDSTRNTAGELIRNRVAVKHKITIDFVPLSLSESADIFEAVKGVSFVTNYLSPEGGIKRGVMYVGDRTTPFLNMDGGYWEGLSMELTEV